MNTKTCTQCNIEQPVANYHKRSMVSSGLDAWCKSCKSNYRKIYFIKNKEKEVLRSRVKAWAGAGIDITNETYLQMQVDQSGKCKICGIEGQTLNVDHCHDTGKIRGLLCGSCNRSLGLLKENPKVILAAYHYVLDATL